ncbi:MAG: ParB/RepB/Spo0J family partition protein [Treponema sp.]|nr:ParB/RepB/Spo0J family partition protein [Treponema sp.]
MAKLGGLGLGRGLDALMGGPSAAEKEIKEATTKAEEKKSEVKASASTPAAESKVPAGITVDENGGLWAELSYLFANPNQPRKDFKQKELDELADSIREHGVIEPILVEKTDTEKFCIIAGERRYRAAVQAGVQKVPVQIRKYDEVKKLEVMLIENIQRADLNPIDEAQAYANLMNIGDLSQEEVAKRVGKGRPTIANAIRLLKLPSDMQKSLVDGQITAGHARALLSVKNDADQRILFGKIIGSGMSVRDAEEAANSLNNGGRAATKKDEKKKNVKRDPDIVAIEQKFIDIFGTKVTLKGSIDKGSIEIDYFSKQDLDRLYNVIAR